MGSYTLYGAEVSYYTGKARAYLRWRGVPFTEVNATQNVYRDVILPHVGWPVIPVLQTPNGEIIQDTADIIDTVEREAGKSPSVNPEGEVQQFVNELLHLYADEWLVLPAMHYRWNYDEHWAYAEFGKMSAPELSPEEQYERGAKNGQRFKGALPVLGVTETTRDAVERSYEGFLDDLSALLEDQDYLFGNRPTLADFAMIGPLFAHLWRDPTPRQLMETRAPRVVDYVHRVHNGAAGTGNVLDNDAISEKLYPILARQMSEQTGALQQTQELFDVWQRQADPGSVVPRALGSITVSINGSAGPAAARSFPLFRLQRALDAYDNMSGAAKTRADALLQGVGGEQILTLRPTARLCRRQCKLSLEMA